MQDPFDPQVAALSKAIFQHESGGDFNAVGDAGTSHGAGQWQAGTWKQHAKMVLGDENAQMTPENQKAVIYGVIKQDKASGLNPAQIAAKWNSGKPDGWENKIGTTTINGQQIKYNVPQYVKGVTDLYQQNKSQYDQPNIKPQQPATEPENPNYFTSMGQDAENLTNSNNIGDKALGYFGKASLGGLKFIGADKPISYIGEQLENKLGYNNRPDNYQETTGRQALAGTAETALNFVGGAEAKGAVKALQASKGLLPQVAKGLGLGYAYDVASKNAEGETGAESFTPGLATGLLGALPVVGKGAGLLKDIIKPSTAKIVENNIKGIDELIIKYPALQKVIAKASSQGHDVKSILANTDLLHGAVDDTGHINTTDAINQLNDFIKPYEKVVTEALAKEGRTIPLSLVEKELRNTINNSGLEGASLEAAHNKIDAALKGLARRMDEYGNLPVSTIHDAKVNAYSTINYMDPASKLADKAIAKTYKTLVENNSTAEIRKLNNELSSHYNVLSFLEKLNNKKVEGGKLGKYFAQTAGNIIGAHFGPLGSIVGGELASRMKGAQMASNFARKTGKKMEASGLMQKTMANNKAPKKPLLQLPAPSIKAGGENIFKQKVDMQGKVISPVEGKMNVSNVVDDIRTNQRYGLDENGNVIPFDPYTSKDVDNYLTKKMDLDEIKDAKKQIIEGTPYGDTKSFREYLNARFNDQLAVIQKYVRALSTSRDGDLAELLQGRARIGGRKATQAEEARMRLGELRDTRSKLSLNVDDDAQMIAQHMPEEIRNKDSYEIIQYAVNEYKSELENFKNYQTTLKELKNKEKTLSGDIKNIGNGSQYAGAFVGAQNGVTTDENGDTAVDPIKVAEGLLIGGGAVYGAKKLVGNKLEREAKTIAKEKAAKAKIKTDYAKYEKKYGIDPGIMQDSGMVGMMKRYMENPKVQPYEFIRDQLGLPKYASRAAVTKAVKDILKNTR